MTEPKTLSPLFADQRQIEVVRLTEWLDFVCGVSPSVKVILPMIQRGSVWSADKVVNLWDSLLRGMPVGGLTVAIPEAGLEITKRDVLSKEALKSVVAEGTLSLLDGQQRTLAMCVGWPCAEVENRRLWVDFGQDAQAGEPFCLRLTTQSQPFGYRPDDQKQRLHRWQRWRARDDFDKRTAKKYSALPDYQLPLNETTPFDSSPLVMQLRTLIDLWLIKEDRATWQESIMLKLNSDDRQVAARVLVMGESLQRFSEMQIALIRVGSHLLNDTLETGIEADDVAPPLVVLFQRIANAGAPLTPEDYVFSLIKHRFPEAHNLVQALHGFENISSLMSANDLVMTAIRLASNTHKDEADRPFPDLVSPSPRDFNRIIRRHLAGGRDFLTGAVHPLLGVDERGSLRAAFSLVQKVLLYRPDSDEQDAGIPRLAFPILHRPLLQILVFWAHRLLTDTSTMADAETIAESSRGEVLRFTLFWLVALEQTSKVRNNASKLAFQHFRETEDLSFPGKRLAALLCEEDLAIEMQVPEAMRPLLYPAEVGGERFIPTRTKVFCQQDANGRRSAAQWLAEYWSTRHHLLLWLQRAGICNGTTCKDVNVLAGPEHSDETPYDFDHICPQDDWHRSWHHSSITLFRSFCDDTNQHVSIGNSIGNYRIWDSSANRGDGNSSPASKLHLSTEADPSKQAVALRASAISKEEAEFWQTASSMDRDGHWDADRARAFHFVVGQRAMRLYELLFNEAGFSLWCDESQPRGHAAKSALKT